MTDGGSGLGGREHRDTCPPCREISENFLNGHFIKMFTLVKFKKLNKYQQNFKSVAFE